MAQKVFRGVEAHQEVSIANRRDDVRSIWTRLGDALDTPRGTAMYFGVLAGLAAVPLCFVPGSGEVGVCAALATLSLRYNYKTRLWEAPFRVPAYLGKKLGLKDGTTGRAAQGLIYLGREINTNRQVWATPNDVRTHRLVIGTTGSGKTEEILGNTFSTLALDSGAMMVDGKSDPKTFNSLFAVCRVLGRDEDMFVLNYIMGGRDFADGMDSRRSHTYNPLGSGSAAMKSELMVSLLDSGSGGGGDMWQGRAISFLEAICPPLSYLADRGIVLFNPGLLCEYFLLENIENLLWFGILRDMNGNNVDLKHGTDDQRRIFNTLTEKYCGNLRVYVENLPGYSAVKPKKPHNPSYMSQEEFGAYMSDLQVRWKAYVESAGAEGDDKKKQTAEQTRGKVLEQHGFITMQLVRATGNMTFNYGHIYNDEIGEINYRDMLLNRRIQLVMLPALERSKQTMEQLGKMAVSSIKGVLATLLDTPLEGRRREIIDGRPSNAEIAMSVTLDEYGYYVVPGFAAAPAQARSYGVSITFGTQTYTDLLKGNKEEGEATWENTNLRECGRMTGGEKSETFSKFAGAAGQATVSVAQEMDYNYGVSFDRFTLGRGSRLEKVDRISSDDLVQQQDGEFHLVVGAKSKMVGGTAKHGAAKVVRLLAFYTGNIPQPDRLALVHYVQVKAFSEAERDTVMQNEGIARALAGISDEALHTAMMEKAKVLRSKRGREYVLERFMWRAGMGAGAGRGTDAMARDEGAGGWDMSKADIVRWLDRYDAMRLKEIAAESAVVERDKRFRMIGESVQHVADLAYRDGLVKAAHMRLVQSIMDGWKARVEASGVDPMVMAATLREKTGEAHHLMAAQD